MRKTQTNNTTTPATTTASRVRPQWKLENEVFKITNWDSLNTEQQKYLSKFNNKKVTTKLTREALIEAIKANEGPANVVPPKKEAPKPTTPQTAMKEAADAILESAATKTVQKKSAPKEGDIVVLDEETQLGVKLLPKNAKVKVGMWVYLPELTVASEDDEDEIETMTDVFFEVMVVAQQTMWMFNHESEDMIPVSTQSASQHCIDLDGSNNPKDWLPFYIGELCDIPKKATTAKPEPKQQPTTQQKSKEPEKKADSKPASSESSTKTTTKKAGTTKRRAS